MANSQTSVSDEELRTELAKNPSVLEHAQQEATRAYQKALGFTNAPRGKIEGQWDVFRKRTQEAARRAAGANVNSELDQLSRVERLKIAREAIRTFGHYITLTPQELAAMGRRVKEDAERAVLLKSMPVAAPPAFDAATAVRQLAAKNVILTAGPGGSLVASGAGNLTDAERDRLRHNKAAVLAVLGDQWTIA